MTVTEKKLVSTVDIMPTWIELLPMMLHFLTTGTEQQKVIMKEQLERMARAADAHNETSRVIRQKTEEIVTSLANIGKK